jgi:acyl-homoserine-lactone acylase
MAAVLVVVGCAPIEPEATPVDTTAVVAAPGDYVATITYTAHGIPHITADDLGSVGFGQGWAAASDRGCELFDQITKVRGERARWQGAGPAGAYVDSDLAYRAWNLRGRAEALWPTLSADAQAMTEGYAAGVSAWLAETGADAVPGWCAGALWLGPIDALDLVAYHHDLAMVTSGRRLIPAVASAQPPDPSGAVASTGPPALPAPADVSAVAWALGRGATGTTTSVLGSATAFAWEGELALWENQLTVPGELNVYGMSLVGLPGVFNGFNESVAWTQVPSAGQRLTYVDLELVPGNPTAYRVGDATVDMTPVPVSVEVAEGATPTVERTLWTTQWGPVITPPGMPWTTERAFAYGDAAVVRPALVDQFLGMASAASTAELDAVHATVGATGFTQTVAVTATGWALLTDAAPTPAVADEVLLDAQVAAVDDPVAAAVAATGAVLLDGTNPAAVWETREGAVAAGLLPYAALPRAQVRDWLVATGDNVWVPNDDRRLTFSSPLVGPSGVPLSTAARHALRTVGDLVATARDEGRDLGAADVRTAMFANEGLVSGLVRQAVVERCRAVDTVEVPARFTAEGAQVWPAQVVSMGEICDLVERWRTTWGLDDQATAVWDVFLASFEPGELLDAGRLFANGFDPADPIGTPNGLAAAPVTGPDPVVAALAEAAVAVRTAGLDIDEFWRQVQWTQRGGERIPVHGGTGRDGTTTIARRSSSSSSLAPSFDVGEVVDARSGLRRGGRGVQGGTGAVMVVAFTAEGVEAEALVVHGQSSDPLSPFHVDQAYRFSDKAWRPVRFDADDIATDTQRTLVVSGGLR